MITLVPYVELNGVRTMSDDVIRAAWQLMEAEGVSEVVFSSKEVGDEDQMIRYLKNPGNLVVFAFVEDSLAGLAWLNGMAKNHALAHFCFFRSALGKYTVDIGQKILAYWFSMPRADGGFLFEVIVGQTPEWNRKASAYIERLGMTKLGVIPKICDGKGMIISYLERSTWAERATATAA